MISLLAPLAAREGLCSTSRRWCPGPSPLSEIGLVPGGKWTSTVAAVSCLPSSSCQCGRLDGEWVITGIYGITAWAWLEYVLSWELELTAVVT
jgi:hypothetical protein